MRLKKFDLNLLVVLDALLTEKSATRAAGKLNLSQPAVSAALARLREHFHDELLMQVGRNLAPTSLGKSLAAPVRELLMRAGATLDASSAFDPASSTRRFRLMFTDYISAVLMTEVARVINSVAPGVSLEIYPPGIAPDESIDNGDIDLLLLPKEYLSARHPLEVLFPEHSVCVVWSGNTRIKSRLSMKQYLDAGHVIASIGAEPKRIPNIVDQWLFDKLGEARRIDVIVPDFSSIPQYIRGTNRIATVHSRLAQLCAARYELKVLPAPLRIPPMQMCIQWNRHHTSDMGISWLRSLIKKVAEETC